MCINTHSHVYIYIYTHIYITYVYIDMPFSEALRRQRCTHVVIWSVHSFSPHAAYERFANRVSSFFENLRRLV